MCRSLPIIVGTHGQVLDSGVSIFTGTAVQHTGSACCHMLMLCAATCVVGSQDLSKDDRKKLALKSRGTMPQFGTQERQRVINEMHTRMLELEVRGREYV